MKIVKKIISIFLFILCIFFIYLGFNDNTKKNNLEIVEEIKDNSQNEEEFFKNLEEKNIICKINIPKVTEDYVVMGTDNSYYLDHSIDGKKSKSGALFFDYRTSDEDSVKIIYGHNMDNGTFFSNIVKLYDEDFRRDIKEVTLDYGKTIKKYKPIAIFEVDLDVDRDFIYSNIRNLEKYGRDKFIKNIEKRGFFFEEFSQNKDVLLLSTCNNKKNDARICLVLEEY